MTRVVGDRSDQKPEVDGVNIEINVDGETSNQLNMGPNHMMVTDVE